MSDYETDRMLTRARAALWAELDGMGMTTDAVPSQIEIIDGEPMLDAGPLGGPALTVQFGSYLDETGNPTIPVQKALLYIRRSCRNGHPRHTGPDAWRGSLCHRLLIETVYWGHPIEEAAATLGLDLDRAYRRLRQALSDLFVQLAARQAVPSEAAEPDEMSATRLSRAVCDAVNRQVRDFAVEQRIWEGQRFRDPTLPEWEEVWAKRQATIIEHRLTCERCRGEQAA